MRSPMSLMFIPKLTILVYVLFAAMTITQALPVYYNHELPHYHYVRSIEARALAESPDEGLQPRILKEIWDVVKTVWSVIQNVIDGDKKSRGEFTNKIVGVLAQRKPAFNWIICGVRHKTQFEGGKHQDWGQFEHDFKGKIGHFHYTIYWFRKGSFHRLGDGGYLNWAYSGWMTEKLHEGSEVHFIAPSHKKSGGPPTEACLQDIDNPQKMPAGCPPDLDV